MAEERRLVEQDRNDGLDFPHAARQLAKISATRERCRPPSKPSSKSITKLKKIVILSYIFYFFFV